MIVGLGTGRCGTSSLSFELDCLHEYKPYVTKDFTPDKWRKRKNIITSNSKGDISFANVLALDLLTDDDIAICLVRDKEETITSFLNHKDVSLFKLVFPEHNFTTYSGLSKYYDWYYDTVFKYPKVILLDISQINIKLNRSEYGKARGMERN